MHLRVHAAGERKLAGRAELHAARVLGSVDRRERSPPRRLELLGTFHHRGRLPCFLGGLLSRLVLSNSSLSQRRARVSRGSITSSMYPCSAATYGVASMSRYSRAFSARSEER